MSAFEQRIKEVVVPALRELKQRYEGVTFGFQITQDPSQMYLLVRLEGRLEGEIQGIVGRPISNINNDNSFVQKWLYPFPEKIVVDFWVELNPETRYPFIHPDITLYELEGYIDDLEEALLARLSNKSAISQSV